MANITEPFLIGEGMTGGYGGADILHGCTIAVDPGQIAVIVGPNGAGKSTAMKAVFGMLRIRAAGLALTALVALTQPALADDECAYISRHFELCDAGTDWANGEWEQYGDGATLHLGPLTFDGTEDWASRDDAATPEVEDAVAAILSGSDLRVTVAAHLTDRIDTPHLTVARIVQTESYDGRAPELRAWMIAATPDHRIMVLMTAPPDFPVDEMIRRSSEIAGLIRPEVAE